MFVCVYVCICLYVCMCRQMIPGGHFFPHLKSLPQKQIQILPHRTLWDMNVKEFIMDTTHTHTHRHTHTHTHRHTHTHTHTHAHTHRHTHTHTHTYKHRE